MVRREYLSIESDNNDRIDYYRQISNTEDIKHLGRSIDPVTWSFFNNEQKESLNKLKDYAYSEKKE